MAKEVGDVSVELGKLDIDDKKTGFLYDKYKKSEEITPIASEYVSKPNYNFDPFKTEEQAGYEKELASDEALASAGAFRTAQGDLGFTLETPKNIYDEATSYDNPKGVFDNDNTNTFKGLEFSGGVKSTYSKHKKLSDQLGFGNAMMSTILGGGFPIGSAFTWIAGGWQQRKDQEKFLSDFGRNGFQSLSQGRFKEGPQTARYDKTWEYAQIYGDPMRKDAKTYIRDIFFNNPNPSKLIKDNMYGGKNYEGNAFDATKDFIIQGLQTGVFQENEIRQVADGYTTLKMGSAEWVKSKMAKDALESAGWKIKGAVKISPTGEQFVHGKEWIPGEKTDTGVKKDFSSMFGMEPAVTKAEEPKEEPILKPTMRDIAGKKEPSIPPGRGIPRVEPKQEPRPVSVPREERREPTERQKEVTVSRGAQRGVKSKPKSTSTYRPTMRDIAGAEGGIVSFQEGGPIDGNNAGNLELVNEQGKDQSGVADDVSRELKKGDFVINAPASEMMGYGDITKMVKTAEQELATQGIKVDYKTRDGSVDVKVSNKEVIIPKLLAQQIGYDKLEKINNRGKKRVAEIEEEKKQKQGFVQQQIPEQKAEPQRAQPEGMLAQIGGQITLEENKNQPIAVPRESFATMSSVGKRLLSPLSPEQADKELTELSKPSQSFEGFVKPVKMQDGGKLEFTDKEFDKLIIRESSGDPKSKGDIGTGDTAVGLTQVRGLALEDVNNELGTSYTKDDLLNDPEISKLVGRTYLNQQLKRFGDKRLALAAYNLGPGDVEKITEGSMLNYHKLPSKVKDYVNFVLDEIIPEIKPKPIVPEIKIKPKQTGQNIVPEDITSSPSIANQKRLRSEIMQGMMAVN